MESIGIRLGENIHELLLSEYESDNTIVFDNEYYVILPAIYIDGLKEHYSQYKSVNLKNYNSSTDLMKKEQIKKMLMKGGFIE